MKTTQYISWFDLNLFHSFFKNEVYTAFNIVPVGAIKNLAQKGILKYKKQANQLSFYIELPAYMDSIDEYITAADYYLIVYSTDPQIAGKTVFATLPTPNGEEKDENTIETVYYSNLHEGQKAITVKPKLFMQLLANGTTLEIKDFNGTVIREYTGVAERNTVNVNLSGYDDGIYSVWENGKEVMNFFLTDQNLDTAMAVVQVVAQPLKTQKNLEVHFTAKEAFWNFKIAIKADITVAEDQISIEEFQQANFSAPNKIHLSSNTITYEFNSSKPIAIQADFEESPRLKLGYSDRFSVQTKQMEIKLPNPSFGNLERYQEGDNKGQLFLSKIVYI